MPKGYGYGGESASSKSGKVGMPGGHPIHKHMSNSAFMKVESDKQEEKNLLEKDPIPAKASALEMGHKGSAMPMGHKGSAMPMGHKGGMPMHGALHKGHKGGMPMNQKGSAMPLYSPMKAYHTKK